MPRFASIFATVMTCLFLAASAHAQTAVSIGTLTCTGGEGVGLILGSTKSYACQFTPGNAGPAENYEAKVTKIGVDIGITGTSVIVWTVFSTSQNLRAGMLAGTYAGAAADASVGVGGGAKVLVGGSQNTISLQPLSIQGQSGINLAVGVAAMTLK